MGYVRVLFSLWCAKRNINKPRKHIHRLQQKKLRKLLHYAYFHSEYYRKTFEKAGITSENINTVPLHQFPVTNKEIVMEHFDELVTKKEIKQEELAAFDKDKKQELYQGQYHVVHSSGSTGKPRYFVYDEKAWEQMLTGIIRGALWEMTTKDIIKLLKGKPRILYIAATDGRYGGAMAIGDGVQGLKCSQYFLDINTPIAEWEKIVKKFNPNIIIGYPSAIKMLAEEIDNSKKKICVNRVISCGEPLNPVMRNYLENTFQCPVINFYGASESLALGVEGSLEDGMYLFDDMNVVEVIDEEMYITCLYNYAQPLIRYHISDKIQLSDEKPEDKCSFTKAEVLLCRNEDVMWFEKEDGTKEFIHPLSVEGLCIDGLLDYQFVQTSKQTFRVLAETENITLKSNIKKEMEKHLDIILQEKKLDNIDYEILFVQGIMPDSKTGKKRLIMIKEDDFHETDYKEQAV